MDALVVRASMPNRRERCSKVGLIGHVLISVAWKTTHALFSQHPRYPALSDLAGAWFWLALTVFGGCGPIVPGGGLSD